MPADPLPRRPEPDPAAWCWWGEGGSLESVQDARDGRTRGQAKMNYCRDLGEWDFASVRAWKRYARALTRQDQWDWYRAAYLEDDAPREAPADWQPDMWNEDMPAWEFCRPTDDGAAAVWIVAMKDCPVPASPRGDRAAA